MNIAEPILKLFRKTSIPTVSVGDVVRIHQKIKEGNKERIQVFEGIVIATHNKTNLDSTFTVRKIASGVGVEKTYLLHSPRIVKIEFKRSSDVRRSKLYFLRDLTGKALKMKEGKNTKEAWNEVLATTEPTEATEAEVQEAVVAAAEEEARAGDTVAVDQVDGVTPTLDETTAPEVAELAEPVSEVDNSEPTVEDGGNETVAEEPEGVAEVVEGEETATADGTDIAEDSEPTA